MKPYEGSSVTKLNSSEVFVCIILSKLIRHLKKICIGEHGLQNHYVI